MTKKIRILTGKCGDNTIEEGFYDDLSVDVLARTLWGEARGEGDRGMHAVACVIQNRVAYAKAQGGFWWGNDIISVCQKPYQFSCWNRSDPNYRKLLAVDARDLSYATALRIARRGVAGTLADITCGATHYHAKTILPAWAKGKKPCFTHANHVFYFLPS